MIWEFLGGQEGSAGRDCACFAGNFIICRSCHLKHEIIRLLYYTDLNSNFECFWNGIRAKGARIRKNSMDCPNCHPKHEIIRLFHIFVDLNSNSNCWVWVCVCVCLCIMCAPTCEPHRILAESMCLCQVGLSGEAWQLLERHLHKYTFPNSGHSLPNTKISKVCQLDLNMADGWAGFSCISSPIKNRNLKPQSFEACVIWLWDVSNLLCLYMSLPCQPSAGTPWWTPGGFWMVCPKLLVCAPTGIRS